MVAGIFIGGVPRVRLDALVFEGEGYVGISTRFGPWDSPGLSSNLERRVQVLSCKINRTHTADFSSRSATTEDMLWIFARRHFHFWRSSFLEQSEWLSEYSL